MNKEQSEKLIELVRESLRKRLEREPTEQEVLDRLPLFVCKGDNHAGHGDQV